MREFSYENFAQRVVILLNCPNVQRKYVLFLAKR